MRFFRPWWQVLGLTYDAKELLDATSAPQSESWDLEQFVLGIRAALTTAHPSVELPMRQSTLSEVLDELAMHASRSRWKKSVRYRRWRENPEPSIYKTLAASSTAQLPAGLSGLNASLVCLIALNSITWRRELASERDRLTLQIWRVVSDLATVASEASQEPRAEESNTLHALVALIPTPLNPHAALIKLSEHRNQFLVLADRVDLLTEAFQLLAQHGHLIGGFSELSVAANATEQPPLPDEPSHLLSGIQEAPSPDVGMASPRSQRRSGKPREARSGLSEGRASTGDRGLIAVHLSGPTSTPSAELLSELADAAEALEDRIASDDAVVTEAPLQRGTQWQERSFAVRQRSATRQGFWARDQWDALTAEEVRHIRTLLLRALEAAPDCEISPLREAITLALLCASTGFSADRAFSLKIQGAEGLVVTDDWLALATGRLSMPLPGTEKRFTPTESQRLLLELVGERIEIRLPTELCEATRKLAPTPDGYLFATDLPMLHEHIRELFREERESEPRCTLPRLQRAHQLEVLAQSGDVGLSQLVCGDPLGAATTPTAYYAAKQSTIQASYDRVVTRHGFNTAPPLATAQSTVGSRLLLTQSALASCIAAVSRGVTQTPRMARVAGREILELHRDVVASTALQFMAATAFRPTFRLGEIRSTALCLTASVGVISDKQSDDAHHGRLIPLCPLLRSTLAAYGLHLETMSNNASLSRVQRAAAKGALAGASPLFFVLDGNSARPITPEDLTLRLPSGWPLPMNFLRHRLATELRDVGCPGMYVQAVMGHMEVGIQPFGEESFMDPRHFLRITATHIEECLRADGWRPILGGADHFDVFERHQPPLRHDLTHIEERLRNELDQRFKEGRARVKSLKESSDQQIAQSVRESIAALAPELIQAPSMVHTVSSEQVSALRDVVCSGAEGLTEVELRVEALRDFLVEGRSLHGWKVSRLPRFHVLQATPCVFYSEFVSAYAAIHRLRVEFQRELESTQAAPDGPARMRNCLLALILWHGVADFDRLMGILAGLPQAQRLQSMPDALLVPIDLLGDVDGKHPKQTSEVLRGAVALAAMSAKVALEKPITRAVIESTLRDWLPHKILEAPEGKTLDVLMAATALTHRFESPPPLRLAWTGAVTSISLQAERIRALMTGESSAPGNGPSKVAPDKDHTLTRAPGTGLPKQGHESYQWLKATLRYDQRKTKYFPVDPAVATSLPPGKPARRVPATKQTPAAIRTETLARLRGRLDQWPEDDSLLRALTAYAHERLCIGTPWSPRIEQRTVYRYLVGAATPLLAQHQGEPLCDLDAEDLHELYQSCLDGAAADYRAGLSDYLAYFHGYLVAHGLAPSVAIGRRGQRGACLPDVGYVTPVEIDQSTKTLLAIRDAAQSLAGSVAELEAATASLPLGFASGARTSEVLLREDRELVTSEGRRALLVRRNAFMRIKTHRGTRVLGLEGFLPDADWERLMRWRSNVAALRHGEGNTHVALFPAPGALSPLDPSLLTRWITPALRLVTGCADARPYWWRHTQASNDFLGAFGDPDLLSDLTSATPAEAQGWLPRPLGVTGALATGQPLGQAHAAAFRSRRGHFRIRTSLETYVHVVALIEPPASRGLAARLTSAALGTLAGLSPANTRKRLSRAGITMTQPRLVVDALLGPTAARITDEKNSDRALDSEMRISRPMRIDELARATLRALRLGDFGAMARSLHLTHEETQRRALALAAAAASNVCGLQIPALATGPASKKSTLPRVSARRVYELSLQRIDEPWLLACIERARADASLVGLWRTVLREIDPASGCIAVHNEVEFERLAAKLSEAIGADSRNAKYIITPVFTAGLSPVALGATQAWIEQAGWPPGAYEAADFRPPPGRLSIGVQVRYRASGKRLRQTLLATSLLTCALLTDEQA